MTKREQDWQFMRTVYRGVWRKPKKRKCECEICREKLTKNEKRLCQTSD